METLQRSLLKTIVWRVVATLITFVAVYSFTGTLSKSSTITLTVAVLLAVGYYFNERIWDKIEWGRRHPVTVETTSIRSESFENA